MNYQHIIIGIVFFSFVTNVILSNDKNINNNSREISYKNLNSLNNISYIEVYDNKIAYIFTDDKVNLNITHKKPEFTYNIGNRDIFSNYIKLPGKFRLGHNYFILFVFLFR